MSSKTKRRIAPGDFVVWSHATGNSLGLCIWDSYTAGNKKIIGHIYKKDVAFVLANVVSKHPYYNGFPAMIFIMSGNLVGWTYDSLLERVT